MLNNNTTTSPINREAISISPASHAENTEAPSNFRINLVESEPFQSPPLSTQIQHN
jgi:hypothetical protein